jgi:hypothetical protein
MKLEGGRAIVSRHAGDASDLQRFHEAREVALGPISDRSDEQHI